MDPVDWEHVRVSDGFRVGEAILLTGTLATTAGKGAKYHASHLGHR